MASGASPHKDDFVSGKMCRFSEEKEELHRQGSQPVRSPARIVDPTVHDRVLTA